MVDPAITPSRTDGSEIQADDSSGRPAPTVKHSADTTAACRGLARSSMSTEGAGGGGEVWGGMHRRMMSK